ncbi:MAG: SH3 domain-containing protein [Eubacteriales bacterium]|nr:SH3 domain-containing protein [Eubacteriales bacterium]
MKRKVFWACLALCLLLAGASLAEFAVVSGTDTLNLRSQGSSSSTWLGAYSRNTWVEILGSQNNFDLVRTPDGKTGYMSKNYLTTFSPATATVAVVNNQKSTAFLNLRSYPSYSASVLTILYNGVPLYVKGYSDGWYHVLLNGVEGYVRGEYVYTNTWPASSTVATIKTPNNSKLNMRSGPGNSYDVVRQFDGDRYVMVIAKGDYWFYVSIDGYTGFMSTDFLADGLKAARDISGGGGSGGTAYAVVANPRSTQRLNLRESASTSSRALAQLSNGMRLSRISQGAEWCGVYVDSLGLSGYVMTQYLKLYNLPSSPTKTVYHPQGSYVNLRKSPSLTGSVVARLSSGSSATVLAPGSEWTKVQCRVNGGSATGYVLNYFLSN